MFISKARHAELIAAKNSVIEGLKLEAESLTHTNYALDRTAAKYKAERDAARAELAPLKAIRERQLANLIAANDRRKLTALAKRA